MQIKNGGRPIAMIKKLLSLPPHLVESFHSVTGLNPAEWFCASDPEGAGVGSGGGTIALLDTWRENKESYDERAKRIIIHACGQSRRLPAYAPLGKILTPIPVFRWASGQCIDQTLLNLQLPLYEQILDEAPSRLRTLVASGDTLVRADICSMRGVIGDDVDVACFGTWADAERASHHGVFVVDRKTPTELHHMLQKPGTQELDRLSHNYYYLLDTGIWLLSDRALDLIARQARGRGGRDGELGFYDLYGEFGCALGKVPLRGGDAEFSKLKVAVVPLDEGGFYHFGTSRDLINSTLALQSLVTDQRLILQNKVKSHPSIFTQNCRMLAPLDERNHDIWIENAFVGSKWRLSYDNIVTGVPENDWIISLAPGLCLDMVAIDEDMWAIRTYGMDDSMRGDISNALTMWMGAPMHEWLFKRNIAIEQIGEDSDIQNARIFPLVRNISDAEALIKWILGENDSDELRELWLTSERLSATDLQRRASIGRLRSQRMRMQRKDLQLMSGNWQRSVFYQLDLSDAAQKLDNPPEPLPDEAPVMTQARNRMLRSIMLNDADEETAAFGLLQQSVLDVVREKKQLPRRVTCSDQIVWARSPVRIDLAGGWTDTPPFSLTAGGAVVNMAVELNGQPPLQAFVKPCQRPEIVIRSIDMSAGEVVSDWESLKDYHKVGSPFSIPKAALSLAGFAPEFCRCKYGSLREQLMDFGSGIEVTILSAVPAGSGLGTSSILASTVLAAVNEFAGLGWSQTEICTRTLALEQLLTTGGGWQDQFGGVIGGIKLLQTEPGILQEPHTLWLPDMLLTSPEYSPCHLLYYTGLTRVAKNILSEIVRGMFLNKGRELRLLERMKEHALEMSDAIQGCRFERFGHLVAETWRQNQALDAGTNPVAVENIIKKVADLCLGLKLPGAGGGGFLYMIAKDPDAAARIKRILTSTPPNAGARFVDMTLSKTGLRVSRS